MQVCSWGHDQLIRGCVTLAWMSWCGFEINFRNFAPLVLQIDKWIIPPTPPPLTSEDKLVDKSSREVSKCLRHAGRPAVFAVGACHREEDARHTGDNLWVCGGWTDGQTNRRFRSFFTSLPCGVLFLFFSFLLSQFSTDMRKLQSSPLSFMQIWLLITVTARETQQDVAPVESVWDEDDVLSWEWLATNVFKNPNSCFRKGKLFQ